MWAHDDQPVMICHDESKRYDAFECIWIYLNHFDSSHASKVQLLSKESSTAQRITRCLLALEQNPGQRRVPQLHWHMFCCDWYKGLFTRSYCQGLRLFWSFTMPNCGRIGCDTVALEVLRSLSKLLTAKVRWPVGQPKGMFINSMHQEIAWVSEATLHTRDHAVVVASGKSSWAWTCQKRMKVQKSSWRWL